MMKMTKKKLFEKEKEIRLNLQYAIARFRKSKIAFKMRDSHPVECFFGIIDFKEWQRDGKQLHVHLKFNGMDEWNVEKDVVDIDFYIDEEEFEKIRELLR